MTEANGEPKGSSTISKSIRRLQEQQAAQGSQAGAESKKPIRVGSIPPNPMAGRVYDVPGMQHIDEMGRQARRRFAATEDAEQRTVAALETMLKEALAGKQDTTKMLWWARVAGIAGIVAVVLTVLVPVVQAYWPK